MRFFFVRKTCLIKKRAAFVVVFVIDAQSSGSQSKTVKTNKIKTHIWDRFRGKWNFLRGVVGGESQRGLIGPSFLVHLGSSSSCAWNLQHAGSCSLQIHGAHATSRLSFSPHRRHASGRLRLNIQSWHICGRGTWRGELKETHHAWKNVRFWRRQSFRQLPSSWT